MTSIELTFPAGRYHATPWGRHVNEGAVEWPPSPWRLLRALVATWKRKAAHLDEATVKDLLMTLSDPPEYHLPPATFSHTRHYMPWFKKGPGDKTLVFDSFVALDKQDPVVIVWRELNLPESQQNALRELLPLLGTLGRAESWCEGRLGDRIIPEINCKPLNGQQPKGEVVRVLAVDAIAAFRNGENPPTNGKGKGKNESRVPLYDPDWHLCMETLWLHEQRMSMPPGAVWIDYDRPKDAIAPPKLRKRPQPVRPLMQVARLALDSTVLPLVTDTLRVAECARIALMSQHGWLTLTAEGKGKSRIFSGKEVDGKPMSEHRHCYYLPTSERIENQQRGRLDHLTLYAADGFGPQELRAIDRLREIKTSDSVESGHPLSVILLGVGRASEFKPGPVGESCCWISATPFVAPRHPKTSGRLKDSEAGGSDIERFLVAQIREELRRWLERHEIELRAEAIDVKMLLDEFGNSRRWSPDPPHWRERSLQFRRFRQKRGDDGGRRASGFFRVTFPQPVSGPLSLGHSSHFGLGLFVPCPTAALPHTVSLGA